MKRAVAILLTALMVLSLSGCLGGKDFVEINSVNFPDTVVLRKVKQFDKNHNGKLSLSEREKVKTIQMDKVEDLTGIECFPNLETLALDYSDCSGFDFGSIPSVNYIMLFECEIGSLDLSRNLKLEQLRVVDSPLEKLILPASDNLMDINCRNCGLTSIDVTACPKLDHLNVTYNSLTELDISSCPKLISISCYGNKIPELDISNCPELVETVENSIASSHSYGDNAGIYRMYYYDDPGDLNIYGVHIYIENDTELIW